MLLFYITILILGLISGVCMETCPEPEEIYPCECIINNFDKGLIVGCAIGYGLETKLPLELLQPALNGLVGKGNVFLSLTNIQDTLPSDVFAGIGITRLELSYCRLDNLTKDDRPELLGLENYLERLDIGGSSTIPAKFNLGHLKKLREVELTSNNIPELRDDWLNKVPPSLEWLLITENNITKIGRNVFSRLNNLVGLWLNDNRFGPIHRSMFPTTADRLHTLVLENNALTDLPEDLFSRMPSIEHVHLRRNRIRTIDERTWSQIWQQLDILHLDENNIACDNRLSWIIKSKKMSHVSGGCSAPKEFKGMYLHEFFESRSQ